MIFEKKKLLTTILKSIIILGLSGYGINTQAQSGNRYLEIRARAEFELQPLPGATVTVYQGGSKVNSVKTGAGGLFSFKLDMNKLYTIEVSKEGYISKKINFDTSIPEDMGGIWVREFAISVMRNCEGVDYSALKEPVDKIKYNARRKDFDSDKDYVYIMEAKIDDIFRQLDKCMSDKYRNLIDEADRQFKSKDYEEARDNYRAALEVYPNEAYPQKKIDEINQLLAKQENVNDFYKKTIGEADALYAQKKYPDALMKYKGAMTLKPDENYPRERADEIERLIASDRAEQQAANDADMQYNNLVAKGNIDMNSGNYEAAKQSFQSALEIKPDDSSVKLKITELDKLIAERNQQDAKQQTVNNEYNNAITQADRLFASGNYDAAKENYQKAANLKPGENYPVGKIAEINKTIQARNKSEERARQAEIERQYQDALAQGDNLYRSKDYEGATEAYNEAHNLKPEEQYPMLRINQINSTRTAEEAKKQREITAGYQTALAAAQKAEAAKDYETAKNYYQQAQQYKPDDTMLKSKVADLDSRIALVAKQKQQQEATQKQYDDAIQKADQLFTTKDYEAAKAAYREASTIKPGEQYPLRQLQEIDRQVSLAEAQKKRETEAGYQSAVNTANSYYAQKTYEKAKQSYQDALSYKPDDAFAKSRIQEIDNLIRQEQARQTELAARKKQYDEIIAKADGLFTARNYTSAKAEYQRASQILPDQQYPRQRMNEIARLESLAEAQKQRELEAGYQKAINAANGYYAQKSYEEAKNSYQEALTYKPNDNFAKNRIASLESLINQEQARLAAEQAKQKQFDDIIARADNYFNSKNYSSARAEYQKASQINSSESYPKNKIAEIDDLVNRQQLAREKDQDFRNAVTQADRLFNEKKYPEAKTAYENALQVKPDEAYPKAQIDRINDFLAEAEKKKQDELARQKQYDSYIAQGDKYYNTADYQRARESYMRAQQVKPDEEYPKARLAKINELLALAARQQNRTTTGTDAKKTSTSVKKPQLAELKFKDDSERDRYLADLRKKYPEGVTHEVYNEGNKITTRVIVIRNNEAREFRQVYFPSWGGREYSMNGKPITQMFYDDQIKPQNGEYYKKFEF